MSIQGIDVSKHNGTIDWAKVKAAGIDFAILRAGYGNVISQKDSTFDYNITHALANGINVGVYWFSYAISASDAVKEANVCMQVIAPYKDKMKYPVFFDYEYDSITYSKKQGVTPTNELINNIANAFCQEVKKSGYQVGIYTNLDFIRSGKFSANTISQYDLWLADYTGSPDVSCAIQQTRSDGQVDGITSSGVDMDVCFKDYVGEDKAICDTRADFTVAKGGTYQFKVTSHHLPNFTLGTPNVFQLDFNGQSGYDYYYRITAIGEVGQSTGCYVDGEKQCVATIAPAKVISDTPEYLNVKKGSTYQFKLTADTKPTFVCGTGTVFSVQYVNNIGKDYFFKVTAIGNVGEQAGFYINGERRTIGTII